MGHARRIAASVLRVPKNTKDAPMGSLLVRLWKETDGQGIAEYAMMLAVVLALVAATIQMIGIHASDVFSRVASAIQ
jgi:Flp pilus assembly pilin Flp